jgi:hypothetical protein
MALTRTSRPFLGSTVPTASTYVSGNLSLPVFSAA